MPLVLSKSLHRALFWYRDFKEDAEGPFQDQLKMCFQFSHHKSVTGRRLVFIALVKEVVSKLALGRASALRMFS